MDQTPKSPKPAKAPTAAKASKAQKPKKAIAPDAIVVRYDLHALPTAQHKAGLAGLLLQIDSMNERRQAGAAGVDEPPTIVARDATSAEIRFTAATTQALFDDLYAAAIVEAVVATKWQGSEPKEIREVEVIDRDTKKAKREKRFVYDVVQPTGRFLARYTDGGREIWHKLWRDMLWAIPRGKPLTRGPFNARADGKPTKDGADAWKELLAFEKAKSKGELRTIEVAGAILLGAQAISAEAVGFEDRADHAVLLHYWQLTARIYVPELIDADGQRAFVGYTLAIPDVSDLERFGEAYRRELEFLDPKPRGYRPAAAIVSIAAEGSLAFMHDLDRVAAARAVAQRSQDYLAGVEFFHMVKVGNNIKTASHGRVAPDPQLLSMYAGLVGDGGPRNPIMLAGRMRAMLEGAPWFACLGDDLVEREWSWFVHSRKEGHATTPAMMSFAGDAARRFREIERRVHQMNVDAAPNDRVVPPEGVDAVVFRMVDELVTRRARARLGVPEDAPRRGPKTHYQATGKDGQPRWQELSDYQEKRRDAASSLYLKLRSRHGEDFVEQFTKELGAVAQYLPTGDFVLLSAALMRPFTEDLTERRPRTRDDVKNLTLLALSAASRSLSAKSDDAQQPAGDGEGE